MKTIDDVVAEAPEGSSMHLRSEFGVFKVTVLAPQVVRVQLGDGADEAPVRYCCIQSPPRLKLRGVRKRADSLRTKSLVVRVGTSPFRVSFARTDGTSLISELSFAVSGIEEHRAVPASSSTTARNDKDESGRFQISFRMPDGHHFYGLGHGGQQFDRVGGQRQFWNSHVGHGTGSDIGMPILVSNYGYALLFDNTSDARITIGRNERFTQVLFDAESGPVDVIFICADTVRELFPVMVDVVGRAPLPPKWFLGYLQSTRHFEKTEEIQDLAATLRRKRIPCDALIFLSTYSEALGWNRQVGHLDFEPTLWPNPGELIGEMREMGFHTLLHEYPVINRYSPLFREAERSGYLLAEGYPVVDPARRPPASYEDGQRFIDFSNPDARAWWWRAHNELIAAGVSGWWIDGGEGPPASSELAAGSARELHNVYDILRCRAFYEGESSSRPNARPVLLCRSGGLGMQRFGAACWSGDVDNSFSTLRAQIPLGLNLSMSGVPYWGTDIGGFFHPTEEKAELYARWFEFGAFCPVFRSHGWVWREHLPWAHGTEVEKICRKYAELRYSLLPYTYSLAWQAFQNGLPLMRPLCLNYPQDPNVWDIGDEYLWGDDLLVCPVTREGARHWAVYFPEGTWHDFWTDETYQGGRAAEVEAPLDRLPLFVRDGAIIPMAPPRQYVGEAEEDELDLVVYPNGRSSYELYEDDGKTNAYRLGDHAVTQIECRCHETHIEIGIAEHVHGGAEILRRRYCVAKVRSPLPQLVLGRRGEHFPRVQNRDEKRAGWWYDDRGIVFVRFPREPSTSITIHFAVESAGRKPPPQRESRTSREP